MVIPNSKIWGDFITNVTAERLRRVDMVFGISYSDSIEKTEAVLHKMMNEDPLILDDPEPEPQIKVHTEKMFIKSPWQLLHALLYLLYPYNYHPSLPQQGRTYEQSTRQYSMTDSVARMKRSGIRALLSNSLDYASFIRATFICNLKQSLFIKSMLMEY